MFSLNSSKKKFFSLLFCGLMLFSMSGSLALAQDSGTGSPTTGTSSSGTGSPTGTSTGNSSSSSATVSTTFANPLEYNTVNELLLSVWETVQTVLAVIAMIFIVIGGILYMTSAGNEKRMELAKSAITAAMIGLAIAVAAPSFLQEIATILGWGVEDETVSGALSIGQILLNTLNFLLGIVGVLAIIMLVFAGIMYFASAGDEKKIETAKNMTKWSIVGIAVALGAMVIVRQIGTFFA